MRFLWITCLAAVMAVAGLRSARAAEPFALRSGDRIAFLGDTFLEREGEFGDLEALLTATHPDRDLVFRNLSWAADTPLGRSRASFDWNKSGNDWLKRVREQVALVRPTVAILSYGMTAALERGEKGVPDFLTELGQLVDALREVSGGEVRLVVLGPLQQQGVAADSQRARDLAAVTAALRRFAEERQARFVDVQALSAQLSGLRQVSYVSPVTLTAEGHAAVARWVVGDLGLKLPAENAEALAVLERAVQHKNEQFFHRWRPANWTYLFGFRKHEQGQNAVEIPKFDPIVEQWDGRILRLRSLAAQDPAVVSEVRALDERRAAPVTSFQPQPVPAFDVADGFEATLWAENPQLFKPIQMNWDPQGRLWVASSRVYPQIRPGQEAEDAVIVLEDKDGDGRADQSRVFDDRLLIPTGVVPDGRGGCYVGASHQLLHFADLDGDGVADRKTTVLSSFGTEDTHHNLHTLRWGYDGQLYMNQSIYTHTHVETPHGVRRLNSAGIWRFNPDTWEFDIFTKGGCNPWGHHWDQFGNQFFTDGAGFKGVYHAMAGATYFTYADMRREAESISPGAYPKFCSLEVIHSPAFPAEWQGQLITCDFRAHRIVRFALKEVGSTFQTVEQPDLLRSTNVTFRPIDVRLGPDGALYIADWSNPIIQHGEVDFRDPRRDKEHGRIWRVAPKGWPTARKGPALASLSMDGLLDLTLSKSGWEQEQARLLLRQSAGDRVLETARKWLARQTDPRARLEVLWLYSAFGRLPDDLTTQLVQAEDPRFRAAAVRALAR